MWKEKEIISRGTHFYPSYQKKDSCMSLTTTAAAAVAVVLYTVRCHVFVPLLYLHRYVPPTQVLGRCEEADIYVCSTYSTLNRRCRQQTHVLSTTSVNTVQVRLLFGVGEPQSEGPGKEYTEKRRAKGRIKNQLLVSRKHGASNGNGRLRKLSR